MRFLILAACLLFAGGANAEVKLSSSGICHDTSSPWYGRTKNYTPFATLEACLQQGRLPKSSSRSHAATSQSPSQPETSGAQYDRDLFGGWADFDGDCLNTRHELLAQLSTGQTIMDGCYVQRGRWNDPYTGKIFVQASNMDVDHLVPLYWAWHRGADTWTSAQRERFANDPANLFAVDAGTNRSKGAKGPDEWMPPNTAFHCQYMLRFERVMKTYNLTPSATETAQFKTIKQEAC